MPIVARRRAAWAVTPPDPGGSRDGSVCFDDHFGVPGTSTTTPERVLVRFTRNRVHLNRFHAEFRASELGGAVHGIKSHYSPLPLFPVPEITPIDRQFEQLDAPALQENNGHQPVG